MYFESFGNQIVVAQFLITTVKFAWSCRDGCQGQHQAVADTFSKVNIIWAKDRPLSSLVVKVTVSGSFES